MTAPTRRTGEPSPAERVADAVLALPGVVDLHSGVFGEVATYLPGGRVTGIVIRDEDGEVHIVADPARDLLAVAESARDAAEAITGLPFAVVVEDIAKPQEDDR